MLYMLIVIWDQDDKWVKHKPAAEHQGFTVDLDVAWFQENTL